MDSIIEYFLLAEDLTLDDLKGMTKINAYEGNKSRIDTHDPYGPNILDEYLTTMNVRIIGDLVESLVIIPNMNDRTTNITYNVREKTNEEKLINPNEYVPEKNMPYMHINHKRRDEITKAINEVFGKDVNVELDDYKTDANIITIKSRSKSGDIAQILDKANHGYTDRIVLITARYHDVPEKVALLTGIPEEKIKLKIEGARIRGKKPNEYEDMKYRIINGAMVGDDNILIG